VTITRSFLDHDRKRKATIRDHRNAPAADSFYGIPSSGALTLYRLPVAALSLLVALIPRPFHGGSVSGPTKNRRAEGGVAVPHWLIYLAVYLALLIVICFFVRGATR
jgi:hypothetical protein